MPIQSVAAQTASTKPSLVPAQTAPDAGRPLGTGTDDGPYETFTNIEQIVFSFPIPTSYFKEAVEPTGVRAKKLFVSADRKSKLILQGSFSDLPLANLYESDKASIEKRDPKTKFALSSLSEKSYVLSWSDQDRIHYVKKWKTDEREFVIASFEYPPSEKERFDKIIPKVIAGMSASQ